jgi:hypothetical protein
MARFAHHFLDVRLGCVHLLQVLALVSVHLDHSTTTAPTQHQHSTNTAPTQHQHSTNTAHFQTWTTSQHNTAQQKHGKAHLDHIGTPSQSNTGRTPSIAGAT